MNLKDLAEPFKPEDIEWRIQSCGEKNGKIWAICIAYVTSRAIMDRLDEVVGIQNWQSKITPIEKGFLAMIGIDVGGRWVWKEDGAQETDIEATKGGISGAMKRAAVHWGIGRYLYNLDATFAQITPNGKFTGRTKEGKAFKWNPPQLPIWAVPEGTPTEADISKKEDTVTMRDMLMADLLNLESSGTFTELETWYKRNRVDILGMSEIDKTDILARIEEVKGGFNND